MKYDVFSSATLVQQAVSIKTAIATYSQLYKAKKKPALQPSHVRLEALKNVH